MNIAPLTVRPRTKGSIATLAGLAFAAAVITFLLRGISIGEVLDLIASADRRGVALFVVLSLAGSAARTWRYATLLAVQGYLPPITPLFLIVLVRNFCADLLPARIGTLVYIVLAHRRLGVMVHTATATWTQSLIFDLLAMPPLVCIAALTSGGAAGMNAPVLVAGGVALAAVFSAVLLLLPALLRRGADTAARMARVGSRAAPGMRRMADDLDAARRSGVYGRVLILSVIVRASKYASLYVFLYALLRPLGHGWSELDPGKVFLGLAAAELAASLPISGIAGFGAYQGAWVLVFQLLGFDSRIAKMTSLSHHLFTQLYGYGLGLLALGVLSLPLFHRAAISQPLTRPPSPAAAFAFRLAAFFALTAAAAWIAVLSPAPGAASPRASNPLSAAEAANRRTLLQQAGRPIVFDSNRSGTFGIFLLRAPDGAVEPLSDTAEQEMYPDPSPDGSLVAFARALSTQRRSPSDIWIIEVTTRRERRIALNGTFPTFSADGSKIYFERERRALWEADLAAGTERELLAFKDAGSLVKPRVSPDGTRALFTGSSGGGWQILSAEIPAGSPKPLTAGCEAGWESEGDGLYWIKIAGALGESGIFRRALSSEPEQAIVDRDRPWGHEYFPTSSCGDLYLLWASSSSGDHSHLTADYQLFLRNRGSGFTARLTDDGFTNRWPKLLGCP